MTAHSKSLAGTLSFSWLPTEPALQTDTHLLTGSGVEAGTLTRLTRHGMTARLSFAASIWRALRSPRGDDRDTVIAFAKPRTKTSVFTDSPGSH